jgi:hypothetical protein
MSGALERERVPMVTAPVKATRKKIETAAGALPIVRLNPALRLPMTGISPPAAAAQRAMYAYGIEIPEIEVAPVMACVATNDDGTP